MKCLTSLCFLTFYLFVLADEPSKKVESYYPDYRPVYLSQRMSEGKLKERLAQCRHNKIRKSDFSIAHRGAPLLMPEHSQESYEAAALMGAGLIECDVTFTKDKQLVCRHAQCDLHTTTDILLRPELASKCRQPFVAANKKNGMAMARCCTSDITLKEFKTLCAKMDAHDPQATTVEAYVNGGIASWRSSLYAQCGTVMTHKESIQLFKKMGVKFIPELKSPEVSMPYDAEYTKQQYARQMIQEYIDAGVNLTDIFPQSFNIDDVLFWVKTFPELAPNIIYLDDRPYKNFAFKPTLKNMKALKQKGVNTVAPPFWSLLDLSDNDVGFVASDYAQYSKQAGLKLVTWSLERSPPLPVKKDWYYRHLTPALKREGDIYYLLDALVKQAGVTAVFSDWPATTTYYANCMKL